MYDMGTRKRVLSLVSQGRSLNSVSKETGVSRAAIRSWQVNVEPRKRSGLPCPRCGDAPGLSADQAAYSYLLGLYLGDGCINEQRRGVHCLRIVMDNAWPGLVDACEAAMRSVRPDNSVCRVKKQGCVAVTATSKHWPCLFPQHGPGKKHDRKIVLEPWQQEIVDTHPWEFVRGLIHSDGCRIINWTEKVISGELKRYEYPRYFFTNLSDDIITLFTDTLDSVGVEWQQANHRNISIARKASVALMDTHIGPKY
ncbi:MULTISPECIES: transcriptional regulator [unclassified Streptomyces]|uniref:transcriptional regulator n=1 Tax=unclassified Streptomyces TaxID=2593676 RepID=UPI00340AE9B7